MSKEIDSDHLLSSFGQSTATWIKVKFLNSKYWNRKPHQLSIVLSNEVEFEGNWQGDPYGLAGG
jgi:hypothetical protein